MATKSRQTLVYAKARVAPLKRQTIAWLEPEEALMGRQCITAVTEQFRVQIEPVHCWTEFDSGIG